MTQATSLPPMPRQVAPATQRAYESDWRAFASWCAAHGVTTLPASPQTLCLWLSHQVEASYATATITRRLLTIRRAHLAAGHPCPVNTSEVQERWHAARRQLGTAQRRVEPVTLQRLHRMVATCGSEPAGRRDHTLLVIGFAAALRRSELAQLDLDDIGHQHEGLVVTIRRSKSDQYGAGHRLGLPRGTNESTCPVRVLAAWQQLLGTTAGPLLRPVDRHGNIANRYLTGRAIAEIVKRRAAAAGLDPAHYSGHSLRAGFATSAATAGASELAIARQTRHRSLAVLRTYIREGDLFKLNAATQIGL
jgi:site-specific recombinase XerD